MVALNEEKTDPESKGCTLGKRVCARGSTQGSVEEGRKGGVNERGGDEYETRRGSNECNTGAKDCRVVYFVVYLYTKGVG